MTFGRPIPLFHPPLFPSSFFKVAARRSVILPRGPSGETCGAFCADCCQRIDHKAHVFEWANEVTDWQREGLGYSLTD